MDSRRFQTSSSWKAPHPRPYRTEQAPFQHNVYHLRNQLESVTQRLRDAEAQNRRSENEHRQELSKIMSEKSRCLRDLRKCQGEARRYAGQNAQLRNDIQEKEQQLLLEKSKFQISQEKDQRIELLESQVSSKCIDLDTVKTALDEKIKENANNYEKFVQLEAASVEKDQKCKAFEIEIDLLKNGLADMILLCENTPENQVWWDSLPITADRSAIFDRIFPSNSQNDIKTTMARWVG